MFIANVQNTSNMIGRDEYSIGFIVLSSLIVDFLTKNQQLSISKS